MFPGEVSTARMHSLLALGGPALHRPVEMLTTPQRTFGQENRGFLLKISPAQLQGSGSRGAAPVSAVWGPWVGWEHPLHSGS